jgi:alpha-1,3-rhamnosyl/mannosyltransferase
MKIVLSAVTGTRGGPRTYAVALARELARLTPSDAHTLVADAPVDGAELPGVAQVRVPLPARALRPVCEAFLVPLAARRAGCDVFHGTKQTLPRLAPGATVVTIHDLAPHLLPETFPRAAGAWLRRSTASAARRADRVVAVSANTARDVHEHLGVPRERIAVVLNGVEDRFRVDDDPEGRAHVAARHGLPDAYLLCAGTIQPRKNVDVVLDAVDLLRARGRDVPPLVIAGRQGWMSDAVVARARDADHVLFRGDVADDDLPQLYAGALVMISPSSYEGFGLAVAEAMAAGTAVVAGAGSAVDEVVGDAGLRVPPRDAGAVADAIDALLTDGPRREALAAAGRARVARFTWEAAARGTRRAYVAVV